MTVLTKIMSGSDVYFCSVFLSSVYFIKVQSSS